MKTQIISKVLGDKSARNIFLTLTLMATSLFILTSHSSMGKEAKIGTDDNARLVSMSSPSILPSMSFNALSGSGTCIEISKKGQFIDHNLDGYAGIGDSIRYTLKVSNCGTDTLTDIYILDPLVSNIPLTFMSESYTGSGAIFTGSGSLFTGSGSTFIGSGTQMFFPGEMSTVQFNYALTGSGLAKGFILNQATVHAKTKGGMDTEDRSDDADVIDLDPNTPTVTALRVYHCDPNQTKSIACPGSINLVFGADCKAIIDPSNISRDNDIPLIIKVYDDKGNEIDTIRRQHLGLKLEFHAIDTCTGSFCWGKINLELKRLPETVVYYDTIMCGEPFPALANLKSIKSELDQLCFKEVFDLSESFTSSGEICDTIVRVRRISAKVWEHGSFSQVLIRIDSIFEIPLDTSMVSCPLGKSIADAIILECSSLDQYPTPDYIASKFGIKSAYPYVDKGLQAQWKVTKRDSIRSYTVPQTVLVNGVWVTVNVLVQDTLKLMDSVYSVLPLYIPLAPGATCNLSIRFNDEKYGTCAGTETKIHRQWWILDWCNGTIKTCGQWFVIKDTKAPITKMPERDTIATNPWLCTADYKPVAIVTDSCSGFSIKWTSTSGIVGEDGVIRSIKLSDSPVRIILIATDSCGNVAKDTTMLKLIDNSPPVAIAKDELNVSLVTVADTTQVLSAAKVYKESLDKGSHDSDCSEVYTCVLLNKELLDPIIHPQTGIHEKDIYGNLMYHAHQCYIDGTYKQQVITGKDTIFNYWPFVICKDYVKFCCENIGINKVALVVKDASPYSAPSISWTNVNVEDKNEPIVICPEPITVRCGEAYELAKPKIYGSSCLGNNLIHSIEDKLDNCGQGRKIIKWTLNGKLVCTSIVYVESKYSFDPRTIKWPLHRDGSEVEGYRRECQITGKDIDGKDIYSIVETPYSVSMSSAVSCSGLPIDKPVWCLTDCGLVVSSYDDIEVEAGPSCKKIIRRWTLVDWCSWTPNGVNGNKAESFEAIDDKWLKSEKCPGCKKTSSEDLDVYFRYEKVNIDGYYTYDQVIKIEDKTAPIIDVKKNFDVEIFTGADFKDDSYLACAGSALISAKATDYCKDSIFDASTLVWYVEFKSLNGTIISSPKTAQGATATVKTNTGRPGEKSLIIWRVKDACGNQTRDTTIVSYKDNKSPVPVCKRELSLGALDVVTKSVTIWAKDFDHGSFDNCGAIASYFRDKQGLPTPSLKFTCADIPNGVSARIELKLFVGDESGNENYCFVAVRIDDFSNVCEDKDLGAASISGVLHTSKGDMIEKAEVSLSQSQANLTGVEGKYAFVDIATASSYVVAPEKNDDFLNGVSTLDLVLIQRHILGLDVFKDPYKVIAGDVNGDRRISAIDLVHLRQLILGLTNKFPSNKSWRFVDAEQKFSNALIPFPFKEFINIDQLSTSVTDQDFIGVKIGDVSGNAIANSAIQAGARSTEELTIQSDDVFLKKDEERIVEIYSQQFKDITAFQFSMNMNEAQMTDVMGEKISMDQSNYAKLDRELYTFAWYSPISVTQSGVLFKIKVRSDRDQWLSEAVNIHSTPTALEAYKSDGSRLGVSWQFTKSTEQATVSKLELYQNEPNPFTKSTRIIFSIEERELIDFKIMDVTGREVYTLQAPYEKGSHVISIESADLKGSGVYYYHITAGAKQHTKKMILLK